MDFLDEDGIIVDDNGVRLGVVRANGDGTYRAHRAMADPDVVAHWTTLEGAAFALVDCE
jgi:hypothetical protein